MYSLITKSMIFTIFLMLSLSIGGCTGAKPQVADQTLILPKSKEGRIHWRNNYLGHRDGCQSATGDWQKDTYRWKRYPTYRKSWRYGYKTCS